MNDKPLILITNDDGLHSPGLHASVEAVMDLGDLLIIAPSTQQSGMGRSLPGTTPGSICPETLEIDGKVFEAYSFSGSPAQCVMYGTVELASRKVDLVISGVNYGENLGTGSTVSGTIGAALQGADMGMPAMAVSLEVSKEFHYTTNYGDVDWSVAKKMTTAFAKLMLENDLPFDVDVLNINVPSSATMGTPWRLTKQSRQPYYVAVPSGRKNLQDKKRLGYKVQIDFDTLEPNSDIYAFVVDRVISVTPLSIDLTSRVDFNDFCTLLRTRLPELPSNESQTSHR